MRISTSTLSSSVQTQNSVTIVCVCTDKLCEIQKTFCVCIYDDDVIVAKMRFCFNFMVYEH